MKKLLTIALAVVIIGAMAAPSFARRIVPTMQVDDSAGTAISSYAISGSTIINTEGIPLEQNVGFNTLILDVAGGAGVSITYELSNDNSTWYTPYTTDGSTTTSAGTVVSNLTASRWIIFTARMAKWMRFNILPTKAGTITMKYILQEQEE